MRSRVESGQEEYLEEVEEEEEQKEEPSRRRTKEKGGKIAAGTMVMSTGCIKVRKISR